MKRTILLMLFLVYFVVISHIDARSRQFILVQISPGLMQISIMDRSIMMETSKKKFSKFSKNTNSTVSDCGFL